MGFTRVLLSAIVCCVAWPVSAFAELTNVKVTARTVVADGQAFGSTGPYEKLIGRMEFALDPADPRNKAIVDLAYAARAADGKIHFESDFYVLRPVDAARGNGVMLFEIANRGNKLLLPLFNEAPASPDPTTPAHFGNGFLMREGYIIVWVGWEFDVAPALLKVDAPLVADAAAPAAGPLQVQFIVNQRQEGAVLTDAPLYPPADPADAGATLTVRDRFGDPAQLIPRDAWRFATSAGAPRLEVRDGFEPGRLYEVTYRPTGRRVAGVGLAAIRDAASAFRSRSDLPVAGRAAYVLGVSQSGRFLRDFLRDGFNADERGRRVFDAVWPHVAGAAGGSFNEPFATPISASAFVSTRPPFLDPLGKYTPEQQPKIFYTNTSVEYWGQGRAAALAHTSSGKDAKLPDNVRMYLLSGTQHVQSAFPPPRAATTQQLANPVPQREVMRALLRGLDGWVRRGSRPPESRYPRVDDKTLVPVAGLRFPPLPGVRDPKTASGPAQIVSGKVVPFPFLVPQVDADGNEIGGIRVPDVSVPLATTTGWNFRAERVGNTGELLALAGSYIPFAATKAERQQGDPRRSVEERYAGRDEYLQKIRAAAADLVKQKYLLEEDIELVLERAKAHWDYANAKR